MKHLRRNAVFAISFFVLAAVTVSAATLPADWQHEQTFDATTAGLVKMSLPIETLDAARPALEDLRVYDDAGNEVPYLIEHPTPAARVIRNAKSFQTSLNAQNTVIKIETGMDQPLNAVFLESPANNFIKSVAVEGSSDGRTWKNIAQNIPIFRQASGLTELRIEIPPNQFTWLRLTIDDQRSQPIPFTGARVQAASGASAPDEPVDITIADRHETPGQSRLTLRLPAANLTLSQVEIETPEPLFTRDVTFAVPQLKDDSIQEQWVARGTVYRIQLDDKIASQGLSLPMETQVGSRDLLMFVQNDNSPPLAITSVRAMRRPVYLVFLAKNAATYHLLTGNPRCVAPRYDLAALAVNLKSLAVAPVKFSPLKDNPTYRPAEVLPELQDSGTALDVTAWSFRKLVRTVRSGPQQLELDTDVLSHAQPGLGDLRLMRDGKQIPYLLERSSLQHSLSPIESTTIDTHDPKISKWMLKLPNPALPVSRLVCFSATPLFQRDIIASEEVRDERGEKYEHVLGRASWTKKPGDANFQFALSFDTAPQTDTIFLTTQNGDNPPIKLGNFQFYCPVIHLFFEAKTNEALWLYYGNVDASAPHYDLSLVANELLAADKSRAAPAAEERLKAASSATNTSGKSGALFWIILALVVVVLLVVIARLLPPPDD